MLLELLLIELECKIIHLLVPEFQVVRDYLFSDETKHVYTDFKSQGHLVPEIETILIWVKGQALISLFEIVSCFDTISVNSEIIFGFFNLMLLFLLLLLPFFLRILGIGGVLRTAFISF